MKEINHSSGLHLLPRYFKLIGFILVAAALVFLFAAAWIFPGSEMLLPGDTVRYLFDTILIVGLLLAALARNRIEDERSVYIRLQSSYFAFIFVVVYTLLVPVMKWTFSYSASNAVILLLLGYLLMNWLLMRRKK